MRLGYGLIREQLFFRKELIERLPWLIRLRWIAVGAGLAGCAAVYGFHPSLLPLPLPLIIFVLLLCNAVFTVIWQKVPPFTFRHTSQLSGGHVFNAREVRAFTVFAHVQIATDLLILFLMVFFTGGIASPFIYFFIFHIILAGILLPPSSCYAYGALILVATGGLVLHQFWFGTSSTQSSRFGPAVILSYPGLNETALRFGTLAVIILVTALLVTTLKKSLRTKGRELLRLSRALDESNTKLTALYEMVREMGTCSEPRQLMDCATRQAATIMGVKACSIKLMDHRTQTLRFASTYGLSEDYTQSKEGIDIRKSPINRKIIEGSVWSIGNIAEVDYFQYPEDIRKEGIASLVCLPLRVEKMVLGVFCVYGDVAHVFAERDIQFFALMSDLTALEIEKIYSQRNRKWFLQKSAHQLRAPMHTVVSLLSMLEKGYQGGLNQQQQETIVRCSKRLDMLDGLIGDLLKLSESRANLSVQPLRPIRAQDILKTLRCPFEAEAGAKEVEIDFRIDESLPPIQAGERQLDDLFSNLISNAIKYTPQKGRVTVSLSLSEADKINLNVTDTGIGIPQEAVAHLFTEFYRAENARSYTEAGTGLGLVIVKEILDQLKGTVSVESRIGEGSTFTCHLPIQ